MGKPPARRVGGKASNKNGSFSLDLPYPIGPFPKNPSFEDSAGVDIDFADLLDRIKNGNQFKKGKKVEAFAVEEESPKGFGPEHKGKLKISLFNVEAYPNSDIGAGTEIGTYEILVDGVGVGAKVGGYSGIFQAGPFDVKASALKANVAAKLFDDKGLDAKFELNAHLATASIGPLGINIGGISADTGVKIGKEGVGLKVLGIGFELGRRNEVSFSIPGFSISFGVTIPWFDS